MVSRMTGAERLVVVVDPGVGVSAGELAGVWAGDAEASALGEARVEAPAAGGVFFPGVLEFVVIPVVINLGSSALYDVLRRVLHRSKPSGVAVEELELVESTTEQGDRLVVIRRRRESPVS
jgi:hypothetical protein